jgi:hypothetical protein
MKDTIYLISVCVLWFCLSLNLTTRIRERNQYYVNKKLHEAIYRYTELGMAFVVGAMLANILI